VTARRKNLSRLASRGDGIITERLGLGKNQWKNLLTSAIGHDVENGRMELSSTAMICEKVLLVQVLPSCRSQELWAQDIASTSFMILLTLESLLPRR
jgi:hypothetical protein